MNISTIKTVTRRPINSLFHLKPARPVGVLSQQDLKRIVAEVIG